MTRRATTNGTAAALVRGAVAFLVTVAAIVAGLSAAFSTPASASPRMQQTVSADTTTVSPAGPRHFAAPQPRAPAPCETRGCRAASFPPIDVVVLFVHELPGHRYQATACAYEFASRPAVAGGDPVNESDPSGECGCVGLIVAGALGLSVNSELLTVYAELYIEIALAGGLTAGFTLLGAFAVLPTAFLGYAISFYLIHEGAYRGC